VARKPNTNESRKVQPVLTAQYCRYLDQMVEIGYAKTATECAQYLIERGMDDMIRTRTIGPHYKRPKKRR
jgi:hypothetical protein